jgi:hypothetical protein
MLGFRGGSQLLGVRRWLFENGPLRLRINSFPLRGVLRLLLEVAYRHLLFLSLRMRLRLQLGLRLRQSCLLNDLLLLEAQDPGL